jgi:hypothetical protein
MLHLNTNKFLNARQGLPNRGAAKGTFHMPCNGLSSIKEVLLRVLAAAIGSRYPAFVIGRCHHSRPAARPPLRAG